LKSIGLFSCRRISDKGFSEAVRKLPQLQEVDITFCRDLSTDSLENLGRYCPFLKYLKFARSETLHMSYDGDALVIAETMSGLRHLFIRENDLTEVGLIAILDGCPFLETLVLEECYYLILSESLSIRCLEQLKEFKLSNTRDDDLYDSDGYYIGPGDGDYVSPYDY
jgi:F-box/leucine-rich repeat protein 2/20